MIHLDDPEEERNFTVGPTWVLLRLGTGEVWAEEDSPEARFYSMLSWLSWVAKGCHMVRVTKVDCERGIITVESIL